jgi:hypothetical protein
MRKLSLLSQALLSPVLLSSLLPAPALALSKGGKADQVRPQPKTQPPNRREAEAARKGKKSSQPAKPEKGKNDQAKATAQTDKSKQSSAKNAKGKAPERARAQLPARALRTSAKARPENSQKTALTKPTPRKVFAEPAEKPLASRLAPASYVAASEPGEARGKFGKAASRARRVTAEEPEETRAPLPARETASTRTPEILRQPEPARINNRVNDRENEVSKDEQKSARRTRETADSDESVAYQIAYPDKIEVTEYGSTSPTLQSLLALPTARPLTPFGAVVTRSNNLPAKRSDIAIPEQRVLEIQYQLASRGFYNAEPNGVYDEVTIQAMWEFQKNYGLPATGYPSAHSLKRLGLAN